MSEINPLLEVRDLIRYFVVSPRLLQRLLQREERRLLRAVDGVSFVIPKGTTLALVGESGCGKSTLARLVVGLLAPTAGRILFDGQDLALARRKPDQRRRMQMIFQDPYASLNPRWRVGKTIAEPLKAFGLLPSRRAEIERVAELLIQVGLAPDDATKYPHEFSGGQRQRISIARALSTNPDFLVCDEPTSALDVSVQAQILNLMKDLQQRFRLTYLLISHNLAVVRQMADQVGVMYLGRIVELGLVDTVFARPRHPYTQALMAAVPTLIQPRRERRPIGGEVPSPLAPPPGCAFHPRCPLAEPRCRQERPELRRLGETMVACHAATEEMQPLPPSAVGRREPP